MTCQTFQSVESPSLRAGNVWDHGNSDVFSSAVRIQKVRPGDGPPIIYCGPYNDNFTINPEVFPG